MTGTVFDGNEKGVEMAVIKKLQFHVLPWVENPSTLQVDEELTKERLVVEINLQNRPVLLYANS